jgi:hypothetical protein
MFDFLMILLILSTGGGSFDQAATPDASTSPTVAAAPTEANAPAEDPPTYAAEQQVPSGKFTTAIEVKPILTATRSNWVALRDWDGQDLLYVTHLWSWRCGLVAMRVAINDGSYEDWPLPTCHEDTASPNAILESDGLPYRAFPAGSVSRILVEVTYDDLSVDRAEFERKAVMMP